jgi:hypothetical protein
MLEPNVLIANYSDRLRRVPQVPELAGRVVVMAPGEQAVIPRVAYRKVMRTCQGWICRIGDVGANGTITWRVSERPTNDMPPTDPAVGDDEGPPAGIHAEPEPMPDPERLRESRAKATGKGAQKAGGKTKGGS